MDKVTKAVIEGLSHEGRGITTVAGKTVFVEGALPEETVTFTYQRRRGRFDEGQVSAILEPAIDRVVPRCPHVAICAGCSLQHLDPKAQLVFKQQVVLEKLYHLGKVEPKTILAPLSGEPYGYRRRARIGAKYVIKKQKMVFGFHEKNHRYIADLAGCDVLDPRVGKKWSMICDLLATLKCADQVPQIEVAIGDEIPALVFRHLRPLDPIDQEILRKFGEDNVFAIYAQAGGPDTLKEIWWPKEEGNTAHVLNYYLPESGITIAFQPLDFIQVNAKVNQQMVKQVIDLLALEPTDKVLDLFCGLGNFTLPVAKQAKMVVGVEGSQASVSRAWQNASLNGLSNVEFYAQDLQEDCLSAPWVKTPYDKVILDPPRAGAKALLPLLAKSKATRIVYISCDPSTLARDVGLLVHQYGFQLSTLGICDMFPHTAHIESIALLER